MGNIGTKNIDRKYLLDKCRIYRSKIIFFVRINSAKFGRISLAESNFGRIKVWPNKFWPKKFGRINFLAELVWPNPTLAESNFGRINIQP